MRKATLRAGLGAATLLLGAVHMSRGANRESNLDPQAFDMVERGRYLAVAADCAACHTDPAADKPFAGGRPIQTPFGAVLAPNITPDRETGIGGWTDDEFDAALRQGKMPGGERLYPAMPYTYYAKMTREDVLAVRAYLNSVAAVRNAVVADQLPFPFNIRASMWVWDALYFSPGEYKADASRSAAWNRGAYLVEGPGHCGACHTPKSSLGGDKTNDYLRGYSIQGWFAPDLTNDARTGLGAWSVADITEYLRKGHNRVAGASGPMAEEVSDSSSLMTRSDLEAIAVYLKDRKAESPNRAPVGGSDPAMKAGAAIYADLCSACHKPDGTGIPYLIPNLAGSSAVASRGPTSVFQVVLRGARSVGTAAEPTAPAMPAYGWQLTDAQVAAVVTYVRNSWGHAAAAASPAQARSAREHLAATGGG